MLGVDEPVSHGTRQEIPILRMLRTTLLILDQNMYRNNHRNQNSPVHSNQREQDRFDEFMERSHRFVVSWLSDEDSVIGRVKNVLVCDFL